MADYDSSLGRDYPLSPTPEPNDSTSNNQSLFDMVKNMSNETDKIIAAKKAAGAKEWTDKERSDFQSGKTSDPIGYERLKKRNDEASKIWIQNRLKEMNKK